MGERDGDAAETSKRLQQTRHHSRPRLAQLLFLQVQAMEELHGLLATLVEMAEHQADLLALTELGGQPDEEPERGAPAAEGDDDPELIYDDIPDDDGGDEPLEGELVPQGAEPPGTTP